MASPYGFSGDEPPLLPRNQPESSFSTDAFSAQYPQAQDHFSTESLQSPLEPERPPKPKRKVHGPDHIKHKRSRSGCYTCRQRRIKCDEIRPQCDRCRKGKRDCAYPEPSQARSSRDSARSLSAASDSDSSEIEDDEDGRLPTIDDEDDSPPSHAFSLSSPTNAAGAKSQSPPKSTKISSLNSDHPAKRKPSTARRSAKRSTNTAALSDPSAPKLPRDVLFFLRYHRENITHHHYCLKYDASEFLRTTFVEIAYKYEPLLYAITAFSAYFHTLPRSDGKLYMFLQYYNKSVMLLRKSLGSSTEHTAATLLTILQLAAFEEYLGDWVNVMAHQKAAHEILTQLFTIDNIMQNETRRKILKWYLRFDIMMGLVSGAETRLNREWHAVYADYYIKQAAEQPDDINAIIDEKFAINSLLADDFAHVFGKKLQGAITDEGFATEIKLLNERVEKHDRDLLTAFSDSRTYVKDFPNASADRQDDLPNINATATDYLWADPLYMWNLILLDWYGMKLMYLGQLYQSDLSNSSGVNPALIVELSYRICHFFEGLIFAKRDYTKDVLAAHSNFGLAVTALPKDERHSMWCRKHLALVERCGYIYPPSLRARLSLLWGGIDLESWWLPNDEGLLPVIRQVRDFISDRTVAPPPAMDEQAGSVRDMRALFSAMELKDHDRPGGAGDMYQDSSSGLPTSTSSDFGMPDFDDSWIDYADDDDYDALLQNGSGINTAELGDLDWEAMDVGVGSMASASATTSSPFGGTGAGSTRGTSQGIE